MIEAYDFLIFKPKYNAFYGPQYSGYTNNPKMAGLYTKEQADKTAGGSWSKGDGVKVYKFNSKFVQHRQDGYDRQVVNKMISSLECVTPEDRLKLFAQAVEFKMRGDATNYPDRNCKDRK